VINISLGGKDRSQALQDAVDYAWAKGVVIVASAMNQSTSTPYYPAACNHVIAVSATDRYDTLASFSNYGDWITLSAPGANILTTSRGGGYGYWSGTSFSSPLTAGVAALVLSVNPSLTNADVVNILEQTADDEGAQGFDQYYGWGRVNAAKAVQRALATLQQQPTAVPSAVEPVARNLGEARPIGMPGSRR
jgi:subtilisin family serine protease